MAAFLQCFGKKKCREQYDLKDGGNSQMNGKMKKKRCKCEKVSTITKCPTCKSALIGYWETEDVRLDGGNVSKAVKNCCDNERNSVTESESVSAEDNSPISEIPPIISEPENGASNMAFNADYTPGIGIPYLRTKKDDPNYNMEHRRRGKAVIFNFNTFDNANTNLRTLELNERRGSNKDKLDLANCLKNLGFEVETHDNLRRQKYDKVIDKLRRENHTDADCLIVAIMTHGEKNLIYTSDGSLIPVNGIWEQFESNRCPTLAGKPKIFIIQACRGERYDHGTRINTSVGGSVSTAVQNDVTDSGSFSYVIPNAADILVAFSCPLGHYSWRHSDRGSWFIQSICKVFNEYALQNVELQALLTMVAREVAINFESSTNHIDSDKKKQVPSTSSTLIRNVFFKPKFALNDVPNRPQLPPVTNEVVLPTPPLVNGTSNGQMITVAQVQMAVAEVQSSTPATPILTEPEPAALPGPGEITVTDKSVVENGFDEDLGSEEDPTVATPPEKPILPSN